MQRPAHRYLLVWRTYILFITETHDYLWKDQIHIEVHTWRPRRAPLPITETGYRSHFMTKNEHTQSGGTLRFIKSWLDREATSKKWRDRQCTEQQLNLF